MLSSQTYYSKEPGKRKHQFMIVHSYHSGSVIYLHGMNQSSEYENFSRRIQRSYKFEVTVRNAYNHVKLKQQKPQHNKQDRAGLKNIPIFKMNLQIVNKYKIRNNGKIAIFSKSYR